MSRRTGQIGLFATDGKGTFEAAKLSILPEPTSLPS